MNRVKALLGIEYPIIQAGMVWCSGWRLASAVSQAGGLGMLGAGSMYPAVLREHLEKYRAACDKPFAVNLPLLYPDIDQHLQAIYDYEVPIVFTSAGSPAKLTAQLKDRGIKVVHVVSSAKFAAKAQAAGCDAVVAEGFEAGGHNGREETTTLVLLQLMRQEIDIPVIAAGGIGSGAAMLAAFALGAEAVQVGTLFAAAAESSGHDGYKQKIIESTEGETALVLKQLTPVRLLKNPFWQQVQQAEQAGASREELAALLGRGRSKRGVFEGDWQEGELEVGQIAAAVKEVKPAAQILQELWQGFLAERERVCGLSY